MKKGLKVLSAALFASIALGGLTTLVSCGQSNSGTYENPAINVTVVSIEISEMKTAFTTGEAFDSSSLKVIANLSDETSIVVSSSVTIDSSNVDSSKAGTYTVKVSYRGQEETYQVTYTDAPQTELKFKSATLLATDNEGELKLKAEVNGTVGSIYAILTKSDVTPTAAQIVAGVSYGEGIQIAYNGNSGDTKQLEVTITDLEKGVLYYAYFVIVEGDNYSTIQTKTETTYKKLEDIGTGTVEDPFRIGTIEALEAVGTKEDNSFGINFATSASYILTADIDLSEKYGEGKLSWTPLVLSMSSDDSKFGSFDGNGFTISGLYYNSSTSEKSVGLFESINRGCEVKNLTLENVTIISNSAQEKGKLNGGTGTEVGTTATAPYLGAIAGDLKGSISNCHVSNLTLTATGSRAGGLAGRAYSDDGTAIEIKDSSVSKATITGVSRLGGIVGLIDSKSTATSFTEPKLTNLTFEGNIKGVTTTFIDTAGEATVFGQYIGGIVGYYRTASIKNCFVNANLEGQNHVGGVVGFQQKVASTDEHPTSIENALYKGAIVLVTGSNAGVVGNRSTSKGTNLLDTTNTYVLSSNYIIVGTSDETSVTDFVYAATAVSGTVLESTLITEQWITTNLGEGFVLDTTTGLPKLK